MQFRVQHYIVQQFQSCVENIQIFLAYLILNSADNRVIAKIQSCLEIKIKVLRNHQVNSIKLTPASFQKLLAREGSFKRILAGRS